MAAYFNYLVKGIPAQTKGNSVKQRKMKTSRNRSTKRELIHFNQNGNLNLLIVITLPKTQKEITKCFDYKVFYIPKNGQVSSGFYLSWSKKMSLKHCVFRYSLHVEHNY